MRIGRGGESSGNRRRNPDNDFEQSETGACGARDDMRDHRNVRGTGRLGEPDEEATPTSPAPINCPSPQEEKCRTKLTSCGHN